MGILTPRQKPKKAYPNSDRFEEDGRRIYSSYAAAQGKKRGKRRNLPLAVGGALALALVLALLFWLIGSS
ncbi:MAG: hypothetical protein E5V70_00535 [Mesorhizobium sp.]|nr:MAG: hypothetical protein E5V70_00535 [Mesorhizobium sp.]